MMSTVAATFWQMATAGDLLYHSGISTLAKHHAVVDRADASRLAVTKGEIRFEGQDIGRLPPHRRAR